MNTPYQPDYSARLAELTAYAEKYDNLDSAIDEADQAIAAAQEAMENLFAACEEALRVIGDALGDGRVAERLQGKPYQEVFRRS